MSEDEKNEMLLLLAGIALPGIITTKGGTLFPERIANEAFDLAEAMLTEFKKRTQEEQE